MKDKTRFRAAQVAVLVPLVCAAAAACSGGGSASTNAAGAGGGISITTGHSSFGVIVTGSNGRAVYLFEKDAGTTSSCYGACAAAWPPVLTTGAPAATSGVSPALLGTVRRSDGTTQVTYAGHPLYYFAGDSRAGDVTGEGSQSFGAGWDLLTPTGSKIEKSGS
jgi:predicted lipoprotein with Yx(FWY)xxD motif